MSAYGEASVIAVRSCRAGKVINPVGAWNAAVREVFPKSESQQKKGCPRGAFLGLCEEGLVAGILRGSYTRSKLNKDYAIRAVKLLREDQSQVDAPEVLWKRVVDGAKKVHNQQMDVVIALWNAKVLK